MGRKGGGRVGGGDYCNRTPAFQNGHSGNAKKEGRGSLHFIQKRIDPAPGTHRINIPLPIDSKLEIIHTAQ